MPYKNVNAEIESISPCKNHKFLFVIGSEGPSRVENAKIISYLQFTIYDTLLFQSFYSVRKGKFLSLLTPQLELLCPI